MGVNTAVVRSIETLVAGHRPRCGEVRVVALDGGASSGKTTLAAALGYPIVHTDELLEGWAGQFSFWTRLRTDLLEPLSRGRTGQYRRWDWLTSRWAETVVVPVADVLMIEGVSAIAACGRYASTRIFLDVPRSVREARWVARDGSFEPEWTRWLDAEDEHFATSPAADLVLTYASQSQSADVAPPESRA